MQAYSFTANPVCIHLELPGREAFRLRVNWSSKLKLTGKTSIFPTFGLLRIQQPAKNSGWSTVVNKNLCSQRRFHLFTSIQKSTCKAPKQFLARNPMQKMQSSTFILTWEMLFFLKLRTNESSSNRHFQNGACSTVTKITWLNIDNCWQVNAGALISGSWIEIL